MEKSVLMALLSRHPPVHSQQREMAAQLHTEALKALPVGHKVSLGQRYKGATAFPTDPLSLDFEVALQLWTLALIEEHQAGMVGYMLSHWQRLQELF